MNFHSTINIGLALYVALLYCYSLTDLTSSFFPSIFGINYRLPYLVIYRALEL